MGPTPSRPFLGTATYLASDGRGTKSTVSKDVQSVQVDSYKNKAVIKILSTRVLMKDVNKETYKY